MAEIGNGLWKKSRRGELSDQASFSAQLALVSSLVTIIPDHEIMPRAVDIALALDHAIYDCIYLALAEQVGTEVVTADVDFVCKACAAGFTATVQSL